MKTINKISIAAILLLGLSMVISCGKPCGENSTDSSPQRSKPSSKNIDKLFSKAIDDKGYLSFSTDYGSSKDNLYHMVFFPFVFSDDGLEGIMYLVSYKNLSSSYTSVLVSYYADYMVRGDYLRLTNIIQTTNNTNATPRIYKIDKSDDKLRLEGRFIRQTSKSVNVEETKPLPNSIVNFLENEDYNFHNYQ